MNNKFWVFVAFVTIGVGCVQNDEKSVVQVDTAEVEEQGFDENAPVKMYTLPAPMQVATVLQTERAPYHEQLLIPSKKQKPEYSSNYQRALNIGIYTIDLAYSVVFSQGQNSINYTKTIKELMDETGIKSSIQGDMVERFEANLQQQDSLYQIILEAYERSHGYFRENQQEDVGLHILAGSYLEGLYLTLNHPSILHRKNVKNIIGQQKVFLDNIIDLLEYHEGEEIERLHGAFKKLQRIYDHVHINIDTKPNAPNAGVLSTNFTLTDIDDLRAKCNALRDSIHQP